MMKSADQFYKRGRVILLFAKFLPGIIRWRRRWRAAWGCLYGQFLALDLAGAVGLYSDLLRRGLSVQRFSGLDHAGIFDVRRIVGWLIAGFSASDR